MTEKSLRAPRSLFWVAFGVRIAYVLLAHTYQVKPLEDHFNFGFEAGRIARALANGFGYADPFANAFIAHTGPTAWLPPAYPLLLAGIFKLFGVYTSASALTVLTLQCVASSFTAMAVWELGYRFAGRCNAVWSGWLWALYPAAMQYAVRWFWEMTFTTALFTFVLVLAMRMRDEPARHIVSRWLWFGLAWGLIALFNSTLLLFLPAAGLWILSFSPHLRRSLVAAILAAVVFLACVVPWTLRNQRVFSTFIPLRGNFGAELYLGNGPGANGLLMEHNHPFQSPRQLALYAQMGEVRYVRMRGAAADAAIAANPGLFARNTLKRILFFWVGVPHTASRAAATGEFLRLLNFSFISLAGLLGLLLALKRRMPAAGLFLGAMLLLPLPYYGVSVNARFRHPLEPILCILAVLLFQSAERGKRATTPSSIEGPETIRV